MRCMILTLVAAAALGVSTTTLAQEGQMTVKVEGLDLHSGAGARTALARIRRASEAFCGMDERVASLQRLAASQACTKQMTHSAVVKLDEPRVTALQEGRTWSGEPVAPVMARK